MAGPIGAAALRPERGGARDGRSVRASYDARMAWHDRAVVEAASWRLASDLFRRHPTGTRLLRAHPGGGQADLLWIIGGTDSDLDIRLNRHGTIQVHGRADGRAEYLWPATSWADYLEADPDDFVARLEDAAGLGAPQPELAPTPPSVTYDVLAALAALGVGDAPGITIEQGFIDTSGYGGGRTTSLDRFAIPAALLEARPDDLFGEPRYRWWVACRGREPFVALEQSSATAYFVDRADAFDVAGAHRVAAGDPAVVAAELVRIGLGAT